MIDYVAGGKHQGREQLIGKLKAAGIFNRIEDRGRGLVRVWTGPAFDAMDVQDKERFTGVVYVYYFDGSSFSDAVILDDGRTDKPIGDFMRTGLTMK